jgi:hypothetical protein
VLPGSFEVRVFARALIGDVELAEDFLWRFHDDAGLRSIPFYARGCRDAASSGVLVA